MNPNSRVRRVHPDQPDYQGFDEADYRRRAAIRRRQDIVLGAIIGGILLLAVAAVIILARGPVG